MNNSLKIAALVTFGTGLFALTALSNDEGLTFHQLSTVGANTSVLTPAFPDPQAPAAAGTNELTQIDKRRFAIRLSDTYLLSNPVLKGSAIQ